MRKLLFSTQWIFFILFNFFLLLTVYQVAGPATKDNIFADKAPGYNQKEDFDASLSRLTSINKLIDYCDSLYQERLVSGGDIQYEETYPEIVSTVIRNRFYHGYSHYSMGTNYVASLLAPVTMKGLSAIVIPNDILKYPYAACSQQSIVVMELLRKKGFTTRKVGMSGNISGHFCYEVYYNGSWHFFDPDLEPDQAVLANYQRPGIAFLAKHPEILTAAYHNQPKEMVLDVFTNYYYGPVNSFPAPKAIIFQKITRFLSYTIWSFFLLGFIWTRRKYKQFRNASSQVRVIKLHRFTEKQNLQFPTTYQAGATS